MSSLELLLGVESGIFHVPNGWIKFMLGKHFLVQLKILTLKS